MTDQDLAEISLFVLEGAQIAAETFSVIADNKTFAVAVAKLAAGMRDEFLKQGFSREEALVLVTHGLSSLKVK